MNLAGFLAMIRASRWLRHGLYGSLGLLAVVDLALRRAHGVFWWDALPGFHLLYGFISCVLIIVVSKAIGHWWLMRDEDYYD